MISFFPDKAAYLTWIRRMPGIFPCHDEQKPGKQEDPNEPWVPATAGPYYVSPQFLLLRVGGPAYAARYCALQRVRSEKDADFFWYVPAASSDQAGENVYATYVWDTSTQPEKIVAGNTVAQARAAVMAYLQSSGLETTIFS